MRAASLGARIRAEIEAKIRSGDWPPGHRLPTEQALTEQYGCARMTVSQAIRAMADQGLIERNKRAGSHVARRRVQTTVLKIPDIGAVIRGRGEAYAFLTRSRRVRPPAMDVESEAALAPKGPMLAIEGIHMAGFRPFAEERRVIDLAAAPEAEGADFADEGPGSWLLARVPWTGARHRISAMRARGALARALDIDRGAACLAVERWTFSLAAGVTFVRQTFPGDRYALVAEFEP